MNISQQEIVNKAPKLFNGGTDKEGAFKFKDLKQLENIFPIKIDINTNSSLFKYPKQSIFYITAWENDEGQIHCVRINSIKNNKVILMNPNYPGCKQEIDKATFRSWKKSPILVELL